MVTCSECCPTWTCWRSPSGFGLSWTFFSGGSRSTKKHHLAPSGFSNFGSCSLEMCKVMLWHFSASYLSPRSAPTFPSSVMNFIVRMEVATIAPIRLRAELWLTTSHLTFVLRLFDGSPTVAHNVTKPSGVTLSPEKPTNSSE
ncbi:hypothetical protein PIB30_000367 [Stylosanthes scabra]|uniref:Uncharacterized protein n=1 Tax=Stylosanthes scabra TaxID=79078 RepID=A0ABU6U345_9FABA|nr:hypothetical protein [Stylosanthes scabra]